MAEHWDSICSSPTVDCLELLFQTKSRHGNLKKWKLNLSKNLNRKTFFHFAADLLTQILQKFVVECRLRLNRLVIYAAEWLIGCSWEMKMKQIFVKTWNSFVETWGISSSLCQCRRVGLNKVSTINFSDNGIYASRKKSHKMSNNVGSPDNQIGSAAAAPNIGRLRWAAN